MLIPQYTIRTLLLITAGCAVIFSIFGFAVRGNTAAMGVSAAIVGLVVVLLLHAVLFGLVWAFSVVAARWRGKPTTAGQSPFASTPATPTTAGSTSPSDKDTPATPIILE